MIIEKTDRWIPSTAPVTITEMGEIHEVQYIAKENHGPFIRKISKDQYINRKTGEICDFNHSENRGENLNSLRQTFKKLRYLINNNFSGKRNELWITLTYAKNEQDLKIVAKDFKQFMQRLTYFCQKTYGEAKGTFEYIAIKEPQERGAWHYHMLLKFPKQKSIYIENDVLKSLWKQGFVNIQRAKNIDDLGAYVCAYLTNIVLEEDPEPEVKYDFSVKGPGVKGIFQTKTNPEKRVIKGGRMRYYPLGMNIFSKSKGIVYPERVNSSYSQISRPKELGGYGLRPENLTSRTAIKITDENGKIVNIVIKETYNEQVNNPKSLLYQIRFCEERIETLKQRGGKWAKKAQYWEERRYYLTHKQEINQLTRRYVRKQA
ncbi:rolling circle replication-associated protein [Enterococcus faecalis]|uniref:rolling circle replication-associated protein n=1 Tax=Enterococcus faecalis TaxID=1351 RepID=UPI000C773F0D|nr:hypothetical protein [Enterococcus faecalis]PLA97558.1 hypothetical protein CYR78_01540 [Enterococcus faecalis]